MCKKLNVEEFNLLVDKTQKYMAVHGKYVRLGQAYMNCLNNIREDMYVAITATKYDPFYKNDVIPDFFRYIGDEDVNNFLNLKSNER